MNNEYIGIINDLHMKGFSSDIINKSIDIHKKLTKISNDNKNWLIFYSVYQSVKSLGYTKPNITELMTMFDIDHIDIPKIMDKYKINKNKITKRSRDDIVTIISKFGYNREISESTADIYENYYIKKDNYKHESIIVISLYTSICKYSELAPDIDKMSFMFNMNKFCINKIIKDFENGYIDSVSPKSVNQVK